MTRFVDETSLNERIQSFADAALTLTNNSKAGKDEVTSDVEALECTRDSLIADVMASAQNKIKYLSLFL